MGGEAFFADFSQSALLSIQPREIGLNKQRPSLRLTEFTEKSGSAAD